MEKATALSWQFPFAILWIIPCLFSKSLWIESVFSPFSGFLEIRAIFHHLQVKLSLFKPTNYFLEYKSCIFTCFKLYHLHFSSTFKWNFYLKYLLVYDLNLLLTLNLRFILQYCFRIFLIRFLETIIHIFQKFIFILFHMFVLIEILN